MKMITTILIGAAIGAGLAVSYIVLAFKVQSRESLEREEARRTALWSCFYMLTAQNARLRVALAAGEMTEDGKKIAAVTMAALDAVASAESAATRAALDAEAKEKSAASPVNSPEDARSLLALWRNNEW
jgi:hypothetical protein